MADSVGPLVFDLLGKELSAEEKDILAHPAIGGLIFFARNYESPEQITALCQSVRAARKAPILICVDQEGGRVQRFRQGFTVLPAMGAIGELYDHAPEKALELAHTCGWVMAAELIAVGVDLSFAPLLDIDLKINSAIGTRAFHLDHAVIVALAKALTAGMRAAGMAAVGKHFPGHGSVLVDSHLDLPEDNRLLGEIAAIDMPPFVAMIQAGIEGLMAAHILFSAVDTTAVGFSKTWLQTILRHQLKFSGLIFSDDLNMEGGKIAGDHPQRVAAALAAGCDLALLCNNRSAFIKTLDTLNLDTFRLDEARVAPVRARHKTMTSPLRMTKIWQDKTAIINQFVDKLEA